MSIRTNQLVVGYDKTPLLRDICFAVKPGMVFTLIGPNGCGKSTVLKTITGQLARMGGTISIAGQDMQTLRESEVARHVSMVMTERLRTELMSCRDVVATGRYPYTGRLGILQEEDWRAVDQALAMVHAAEIAGQDFKKISDGQRQRVMLARAICQDTQILILDEPTSFLDMRYKLDILGSIRRLARERHMAVIMSLHELDLAREISDVVACVDGDRIAKIGEPEEVFEGDYLAGLYGVDAKNFDPLTGSMYLSGSVGEPEVFVIGGGGSGIPVYHRMVRTGVAFAAGVLCESDAEYRVASALAENVIACRAFYPVEEAQVEEAKRVIDRCKSCICTLREFGPMNEGNRKLADYAAASGKLC